MLLRVPDTLVAKAEHVELGDGVAKLRCEARSGTAYVTATDGVTVEEANDSPTLAHSLLHGLVFVDPRTRDDPSINAAPGRAGADQGRVGQPRKLTVATAKATVRSSLPGRVR